ncbi:uncharacterized protein CcaverHIS019_0103660 [Cutaneotrichosporon cavernicola]|uniref:DH domain-containing protein n=1 Tax=Cutaneotrichosporon cavernicola TaxID=279322 RepID=A0AA48IHV5_9TREE|nr:uncharacterized protein CcaverHIS019_0103660 [Cutaneotrichosporon cavernicola]BEI87648.1 hypothetical protein CcaverHIS019_0103660 [Cutaneotrichosporon cavernicola]BEI95420.1 hypothetical protein CcaverHIS631_0103690 [Cutaneotrichosporon cavernicola]BEJ03194.1 hypothetical protein CcaverHIS641_0103690 [Cutaneotrichosporon cavernicola]
MLSILPEPAKGRFSVSTMSSSAPVTPSAFIPGRSVRLGDSLPDSEVETASSSGDFPSTYSPDSAPPSAPASSVNLWAVGARYDSPAEETNPGLRIRGGNDQQETLIDGVLWGQKRNPALEPPPTFDEDNPNSASNTFVDKDLPATPKTPKTPQRPGQHPTMRSPSMPQIGANRAQNGNVVQIEAPLSSPNFPRSNTGPVDVNLQPLTVFPQQETTMRPKSMLIASTPVTRSPSLHQMSRRSHLLREIAHTERTHATDLALIRDAYIGQFLRPDSGVQHGPEASTPPMESSRHSRRSSTFGSPMEELGRRTSSHQSDMPRRTSGHQGDGGLRTSGYDGLPRRISGHERRTSTADSGWANTWNGILSPVIKSPRDHGGSTMDLTYSSSGAAWSSTSLLPSPKIPSTPSSMNGVARAGAGMVRPLSQADVKAVFLNISAMAAVSDALATDFEGALGNLDDESSTPDGGGSDRLGEAFLKALSRLRPLYTYYCSRQAQARARLQELQNDPSYSAHLNDCWAKVKAHTHAWNLDSMLIKPVQRVTKYPLLFEDLLSCTTRTHPDYFAIRQAAEGARSLALEVDEAKRRKDVISSVMSSRPSLISGRSSSSMNVTKDPKWAGGGRLLGRFKKDKAPPSGHDQNAILHIGQYAQSQLKDLAKRLSDCERNVRRLLVELPDWCEAARLLLRQKMEINFYFLKWYALGRRVTNDDRIEKVARFSGVLDNVLTGVWEEMNQTVRNSIIVNLDKLHETTKNPLAIIAKLDEKSDVYSRYIAHRQAKKSIDKLLLQEASEYVTVHSQLLEELPAFLEGFTRIYEMSLGAFITAQSKYYETLRDTLALFSAQYLTEPTEMAMVANTIKEVRMDVSTSRGIHRAWLERWREPNSVMKSLQITGGEGSRDTQMRANNLNAGHTNRTSGGSSGSTPSSGRLTSSSRPHSHSRTPSYVARTSTLRTTPSAAASPHSPLEPPSNPRRRSLSLNVETPPGSTGPELRPDSGSIFGSLIRRASNRDRRRESSTSLLDSRSGSSSSNPSIRSTIIKRPSMRREMSTSARSSAAQSRSEENERHSFGLPRIPMTDAKFLFDNLSIDSEKNQAAYATVPPVSYQQQDMSLSALGLGDTTPPADVYYLKPPQPDSYFLQPPHEPNNEGATSEMYTTLMGIDEPDAGETWREARVLYSCCAVADFNPVELGDLRFNSLRFLPLLAGDMVDIFHEIGRVAELLDFPYSQAGVDNDGAVIARSESGRIGVAMCSFLEPLRS